MYPSAVLCVAFVVVSLIMVFVIPAFKEFFTSFGADLPPPTLLVMAISETFVHWWWLIFGGGGAGLFFFMQSWRRNEKLQQLLASLLLRLTIFGVLFEKARVTPWTRPL